MLTPMPVKTGMPTAADARSSSAQHHAQQAAPRKALTKVADEVERAMDDLVKADMVVVRRKDFWIEVEIRTDILFPERERAAAAERRRRDRAARRDASRRSRMPSASRGTPTTGPSRRVAFYLELGAVGGARGQRRARAREQGRRTVAPRGDRLRREPAVADQRHVEGPQRQPSRHHRDPVGGREGSRPKEATDAAIDSGLADAGRSRRRPPQTTQITMRRHWHGFCTLIRATPHASEFRRV